MTDFKSHIKKQEQELSKNVDRVNAEYLKIGSSAYTAGTKMDRNKEYAKIFEHCTEYSTEIQSLSQTISEIKGLDEQLEDRKSGISKRNQDIKSMQLELQNIYEDTGSKLFDLYTSSPQQYLPYDSRFLELDTLYRERFKLESESEQSTSANFVSSLIQQGKRHVVLGKLKKIENKSQNLFKIIAKTIHEMWTSDPQDDPTIQTLISPIIDQLEKIAELNKIVARHKKEISEIHSKKIELAQNKTPDLYFKKLNNKCEELKDLLDREFISLGKILFESNKAPENLKETTEKLKALLAENTSITEFIQQLKAAQKILHLSEEESRLVQREAKIQQQLDDLSKQQKELREAVERLRKEIEEQEAIQGDRDSLMAQLRSKFQSD